MIAGLLDSGAMPVLERLVQFTGVRHRAITNDIANLSTPYFKPSDLDPKQFQAAMRDAIDRRRRAANPTDGSLRPADTPELTFKKDGIEARPHPMDDNILFHDRNNRSLERIMQDLAENTLAHSAGIELLKSEFDLLRTAIRERI